MIYVIAILQLIQLVIIVLMYIDLRGSIGWMERYLGIKK